MSADSGPSVETWVATLVAELELPDDLLDVALILDLARDAAHAVARPAAPLTTFLVGVAAGRAGATADDVVRAVAAAQRALP